MAVGVGLLVAFSFQYAAAGPFDGMFFKKAEGSWIGDGELTNNSDGEITPVHEEWTARTSENGTFLVEGTRKMGEENQEFRWEYSFNPAVELYECEYWHTGMDEPIRFEVSLTDSTSELRSPFGDPGSELKIVNEITDEGIDGSISITNSNGQETVSGMVKHRKSESG